MGIDYKSQFDGIDKAKVTERGNPLTTIAVKQADGSTKYQDAAYDLEITKVITFKTRSLGDAFIVSFRVLASSHPDVKVGDQTHSWFQKMSADGALGSVKAFCLAAMNVSNSDKEKSDMVASKLPELMERICEKEQLLRGKKIHAHVDHTITKKGQDFNRATFSPYQERA